MIPVLSVYILNHMATNDDKLLHFILFI